MGLNNKLMIAKLTIRKWSGNKMDKAVSEQTSIQYHAEARAARVYKSLLPKQALAGVRKAYNAVYTYHYSNTLPWGEAPRRALPTSKYFEYTSKMRELTGKAQTEVNKFLRVYEQQVEAARVMLGDLFNPEDYPSADEIASQFGIDTGFEPLPDAGDFRVDLVEEEIESIREQLREEQQVKAEQAMRDLWNRTFKVVKNMSERLSDPDGVFRNTLVGNVADMAGLLGQMNVTGDPELDKLRREIEDKLVKYDAQALREDDDARVETAKAATEILNKMAAYTGGV